MNRLIYRQPLCPAPQPETNKRQGYENSPDGRKGGNPFLPPLIGYKYRW